MKNYRFYNFERDIILNIIQLERERECVCLWLGLYVLNLEGLQARRRLSFRRVARKQQCAHAHYSTDPAGSSHRRQNCALGSDVKAGVKYNRLDRRT